MEEICLESSCVGSYGSVGISSVRRRSALKSCVGSVGTGEGSPTLFLRDLALTRPPLPRKHLPTRAGVHPFSGGEYPLPPLSGHFRRLWGEGGVYPLRFACTLARFVCLKFWDLGSIARSLGRGSPRTSREGMRGLSYRSRKNPVLCGAYPAGGGAAVQFEFFCHLDYGYGLGIILGVQACNGVHGAMHAFGQGRFRGKPLERPLASAQASSVQACTRSRGDTHPLPSSPLPHWPRDPFRRSPSPLGRRATSWGLPSGRKEMGRRVPGGGEGSGFAGLVTDDRALRPGAMSGCRMVRLWT